MPDSEEDRNALAILGKDNKLKKRMRLKNG